MGLGEKMLFTANLLISCKETMSRCELPTGKKAKGN